MSFPVKFGTYEVFRIILPGFYGLSLLLLTLFLFAPTRQILLEFSQHQVFLFVLAVVGVFLGFGLYAYDHPKKISAYRKLEMPSLYLKKKLCDNCPSQCENRIKDEGEAVDTYFYVLYEIFSPSAQERILYFGSVYHVLADMRMLSFVFGVIIFPISFVSILYRILPFSEGIFGLFAGSFLILFWLYLHPEYFYKKIKSKGDKYEEYVVKMQRRFIDIEIDKIREKFCKRNKTF